LFDCQAAGSKRTEKFGFRPREIKPGHPVFTVKNDHLPVVNGCNIRAGSVVRRVKAAPAPSGIGRYRPAKKNQSSPALVNFHFDFGDLLPVNSKKCDAGIRQRPFGKRRPSERKLMTGAPFGRADGKPHRSCTSL
jgi:hypothetical protein